MVDLSGYVEFIQIPGSMLSSTDPSAKLGSKVFGDCKQVNDKIAEGWEVVWLFSHHLALGMQVLIDVLNLY